jgi:flagellar hook-associated protein 3 FlgL
MRITLDMQNSQSLLNLENDQDQISQISQTLSSGEKLSAPADDPYAWAQSMNIQQGLREYNSVLNNINFATGWEQQTDSALSQLSSLVNQAQQAAISATSATGSDESAALATQVDGILQQALNLANSQYGDQYIFAGTSTSSAPYSIDNSTGVVTYSGDTNPINVRTSVGNPSTGNLTTVNLTGDDVFSFTSGGKTLNVLQEIWNLGQAIQTGDSAAITSEITTMNDAFNHINDESTINGANLSTLSSQKSAISVFQTNDQSNLSNLKDTDMASATTKLSQAQTAYQAALEVTSQLSSLNLASILTGTSTTA